MTWPPVVLYNFSVAVVPVFAGDKWPMPHSSVAVKRHEMRRGQRTFLPLGPIQLLIELCVDK